MVIEYKFGEVYGGLTPKEKKAFREKVCKACQYDKSAFWRRLRGEFSDIKVSEVLVWMKEANKPFHSIVYVKD